MHILASHQTLLLASGGGWTPVLGWWLLEAVPFGLGGLSALLLSLGLVGSAILDRFFGDDDGESDDDPLMDGGGLDGGMDDPFGDDDDMGGMDDPFGDDPFGDDDGGSDDTDELDHRLSELEGEVARLSSTVNTVRSENTEISNTVDDIGENVRKLLDIYEMVTRGINPFVDDVQPGGAGGFESGSLGLFDNDDVEEEEEELDDSIASADAEGFFDDDLLDDDDEFDDLDDEDEFDDLDDDFGTGDVTQEMETEVTDSGGKSFSELKEEYESGDAEWAEDDFGFDEEEAATEQDEFEFGDTEPDGDLLGEDETTDPSETDEMLFEAEDDGEVLAADGAVAGIEDAGLDVESPPDPDESSASGGGFEFGNTTVDETGGDGDDDSAKPYLTTLPDAYIGDLLVIEWLEYLVEHSDVADATRAVRYYERIDWIDTDVARMLEEFLVGFGDVNVAETERTGTRDLSLSHHVKSLEYVQALAGPMPGSVQATRGLGRRSRGGDDGI